MSSCPGCHESMIGDPIPDGVKELFANATHYRREIGVEVRGVYDGVLFWQCPYCGYRWHRWPEGPLRRKAEPYLEVDIVDVHGHYWYKRD